MFARSSIRGSTARPSHGSSRPSEAPYAFLRTTNSFDVRRRPESPPAASAARPASVSETNRCPSSSRRCHTAGSGNSSANGRTQKPSVRSASTMRCWVSSSSGRSCEKRRLLARFAPTRSWSLYVATTPRRSILVPTAWARAASFVRFLCMRATVPVTALRSPRYGAPHEAARGPRPRPLARASRGRARGDGGDAPRLPQRRRRPRRLPRVRAAALRRREPVHRGARARGRGARARRRVEPDLGRHAVLPLQLVQLRLPATAAVRARRRADGAPRRRADRRLPRLRRRHRPADRRAERHVRRRDRVPVAVEPRRAPGARARAARAARDPERARSGDLLPTHVAASRAATGRCASSPRPGRTTRARAPTRCSGSTGSSRRTSR